MARRGRLDDWLQHDQSSDDDDETGATVLMDGAMDIGATSPFGDEEEEDESETVVMGSNDALALMADGLLDEPFEAWADEQETKLDHPTPRAFDWVEPGLHDRDTQVLRPPAGSRAVHGAVPSDPQTTLAHGEEDDEAGSASLLVLGLAVGLVVGGVILATGLAILGLLLM